MKVLFAIRRFCLSTACLMFFLIASNAVAAEQSFWDRVFGTTSEDATISEVVMRRPLKAEGDDIVQRLNGEKDKFEARLRECDDIKQLLFDDYAIAYEDYTAASDEGLKKVYFEELKTTKKRQLALPEYREECEVMIGKIRSFLRRLRQEQMIPKNIANVYEDINKTIQSLLGSDFFDFATRYDISDAEVERLILSQPKSGYYARFMRKGKEHLAGTGSFNSRKDLFYGLIPVFSKIFDCGRHRVSAGGPQQSYCRIA